MTIEAAQASLDPVPLKENPGPPRVFTDHEISLPKRIEHAQRDVPEVADRRRANQKRHVRPYPYAAAEPPAGACTTLAVQPR